MLGLSAAQLIVLGVATAVAVTAVYTAGASGLLVAAPLWLVLAIAGTATFAGRTGGGLGPATRAVGRATTHQQDISRHVAHRTAMPTVLRLPGLSLRIELVDCAGLGGAVVLVDRRGGTVTGVLRVSAPGFVLEDAGTQEHRVAGWGRVACRAVPAAGDRAGAVAVPCAARWADVGSRVVA